MTTTSIPSNSLAKALAYIASGGRLCIRTAIRCTVIDAKTVARFERAGFPVLREDGNGYRLQHGRSSIFILPGQLEAINEDGITFQS